MNDVASERTARVGDRAPRPPQLRPEADVVATWAGATEPIASIVCATYQHADLIGDALDGFLGQVTRFPFEVLVRDDGSTDGTSERIEDYAKRYPRIIRVFLEPENTWPQKRAAFVLQPLTRGQFIAYCEGDDYWVDPGFLAAHVAALQKNPDVALTHSPVVMTRDNRIVRRFDYTGEWTSPRMLPRFPGIPLASMVARNVPVPQPPMQHRISSLDRFHLSVFSRHGSALRLPDAGPSVYRMHAGGSWSSLQGIEQAGRVAESYAWIAQWWRDEGETEIAYHFAKAAVVRLASVLPDIDVGVRRARLKNVRGLVRRALRRARMFVSR